MYWSNILLTVHLLWVWAAFRQKFNNICSIKLSFLQKHNFAVLSKTDGIYFT
jgi:hypothetical protein